MGEGVSARNVSSGEGDVPAVVTCVRVPSGRREVRACGTMIVRASLARAWLKQTRLDCWNEINKFTFFFFLKHYEEK